MKNSEKGIRNNYFNLALCAFSLVFLIVYLVRVDGVHDVALVISQAHIGWLLIAVGCIFVYWLLDAWVLHLAIMPVIPSRSFRSTMRLTMIGQYFNNITPFASGGQPAQAYFLVKRGAPLGETMTALLTKFIVYQITLTIYCLVTLILRFTFFMTEVNALMIAVIVGFIAHTAVTMMLVGVAFFRTGTIKTAHFIITVLGKMRIFKDPAAKRETVDRELDSFHTQFQYMSRHKLHLLKMCLITIVQLTIYFLIGNVIYLSFRLSGADTITLVASQAFVLMIATFMPVPGALGAAEGSFYIFFSLFFPKSMISLAVVLWRLITFYLPIVVGLVFTLLEKKSEPVLLPEGLAPAGQEPFGTPVTDILLTDPQLAEERLEVS